jgi:hypothetical protein
MANQKSTLTVRLKLLFAFSSIIALSLVLIFFSLRAINTITANKTINEKLEVLDRSVSNQELYIKEFIYEGYKDSEFQETGKSELLQRLQTIRSEVAPLMEYLAKEAPSYSAQWNEIERYSGEIQTEFDSVQHHLKVRGFKDYGLEGSLRHAVHVVEKSQTPFSKEKLLTLRRNEKDFFLRKDLKYVNDFSKNVADFRASITNDLALQELIDRYAAEFLRVVEIETKIGLDPSQGLRGQLKRSLEGIRPLLVVFH